jgi:lipopolysaccharide exporter
VGARTARGMIWAYGSYVGGRLLILASTAILARILTPDDFGLVALALTFMALLEGVANLGLGQALVVQKGEDIRERADSVFFAGVALGLTLSVAIAALSPLIASFFDQPDLESLTIVLGANFLLRSFGSTHYALAQKELDFRTRTVAEFADVVVRGSVGVALALAGFGAWSLVLGYLAGTLALNVALWLLVDWRPRLRASFKHIREMVRFGATVSGVNVVAALISNVDYLFVGKALGATALGLYTLAFRLPELIIVNLAVVAQEVLFPAFSAIDRAALRQAFLTSFRFTVMLALPCAVGMIILAEPAVLTLFGEQWKDSVGAMQLLSLYALLATLGIPAGVAYKATGKAGILLWVALARLVLLIVALTLVIDQGIMAAAACQVGVVGLAEVAMIGVASRQFQLPVRRIAAEMLPGLAGSLAMVLPLLAVRGLIETPVIALSVGILVGAATYLLAVAIVAPDSLRYLRDRVLARSGPAPEPPDSLASTHETDVIA